MKTFFVEQSKKKNMVRKFIKSVEIKENKIIIYKNIDEINFSSKIKIANKIKQYMTKQKVKQIVLENDLKNQTDFVKLLYSNNINICDKSWIFKRKLNDVLKDVMKEREYIEELTDLYICVNDVDKVIEDYIYDFAKRFKRITIVTNHIGKFKNIESKLYQEEGILINVTNNKRKSLLKAKIAINFDFPKEILNEFVIFDECIIINVEGDMKIRKKRFCGKIINDFELKTEENDELINIVKENSLQNYDIKEICQAFEFIPKIG